MAVRITRKDKSAGELRQEAARCRDGKAARRMLAIALVLDGVDRKTAAENCGMDRQTLRDWAHRYNAEGVSGLFNRRPPDPPCLLSAAQVDEVRLRRRALLQLRRPPLGNELARRHRVDRHNEDTR